MILIDRNGNILRGWLESFGPVKSDKDSPYRPDFLICLHRTDEQIAQWKHIMELKNLLASTDYWPDKYIEGEYSEEEWEEKKAQRAAWRNEIREMEKTFIDPTITLEEMREAERIAAEKLKAMSETKAGGEAQCR